MGAWTAEERLTLIDMMTDELYAEGAPGIYAYKSYADRVQHLAGSTNDFLERNRNQYTSVIDRYNDEKPEEESEI